MIECKICGEKRHWLVPHIFHSHGMKADEYRAQFPIEVYLRDATLADVFAKRGKANALSAQKKKRVNQKSKGIVDLDKEVECMLCGKRMSWLTSHIKRIHTLTLCDYHGLFPDSPIKSVEAGKTFSRRSQQMQDNRSEEEKSRIAKLRRAGYTESSLKKMSQSQKQRLANVPFAVKSANAKKGAIAIKHKLLDPIEAKNHGCKVSQGWEKAFDANPKLYKECQDRMRKANVKAHENLKAMSDDELYAFLRRSFLRIPKKYSFMYKGVQYGVRSNYEKIVLKALVDCDISFEYEPFFLKLPNGKRYRVDFVVENQIVLEVKAKHWFKEEQNDLRKEASENAGYKYVLFMEDEVFSKDLHSIIKQMATPSSDARAITRLIAGTSLEPLSHNVTSNGKREGLKKSKDLIISSQATLKEVEGSTTRKSNLSFFKYDEIPKNAPQLTM